MFRKLEDLVPESPGFRTLCKTRWTVHGGSLQSVIGNKNVLQDLWDKCLETKLEPDIKGHTRIMRTKHLMGTFDNFYGVNLGGMLLNPLFTDGRYVSQHLKTQINSQISVPGLLFLLIHYFWSLFYSFQFLDCGKVIA